MNALRQLILRFPDANIGILTGLSRVNVVDIDDAKLTGDMICRFGTTPLIVETPSGGVHLYYRGSGEHCRNLRNSEQLPVDIKAIGGFVVVPPSRRPSGPHAGKLYRFVEGGWSDIERLPSMKPGSLPDASAVVQRGPADRGAGLPTAPILEGTRGDTLFRFAREEAPSCDDLDALIDVLRGFNEDCIPPLPDARVVSAARSAWRYKEENRIITAGERRVFNTVSEVEAFQRAKHGSDASLLLLVLRTTHFSGKSFAVAPIPMEAAAIMAGWGKDRYRNALALLVGVGSLEVVRPGGRGKGDPRLYRFADRSSPRHAGRWDHVHDAPATRQIRRP